ncbi:putative tautomerase [Sulfitobacter noctilucicola]|uniref:4-oxalocrotonate tautomerase family enzyme n=1 Tax=Sulfitobacter noctilucicola TaxID=1342301 RepID=A0A7W6M9N7_9RHOB|nr:tautomerase family protein [Sulfitobacter noctilucicola]KIN63473.1 putative tautomerase [Sulfitobacter noctilucicola]MBB4175016.1 4-oxalocrotonate tautomerase family enzyme [Sulfitobacter noctilucicola]
MPIVEVHILSGYDAEAKRRLGEALTDAVRFVVPAPPEAVTVMIHEMPGEHYYRGRTQRSGAPALADPKEIVRSYLLAMERRDIDTAQEMLGDGFVMQFPGTAPMSKLSELIEWAAPRYRSVTKTYEGFDAMQSSSDAAIVYARGTLSGVWPDGTDFEGIRFIDRFELIGGLITQQDVWNDIAEVRAST